MEIWKKQFQTEEIVSAKVLRYELGECEEQEGGQFGETEFNSRELASMEQKKILRVKVMHIFET